MASTTVPASPKAAKTHARKKSTGATGASSTTTIAKRDGLATGATSKLPPLLRFPLVVLLNLSLSSLLYTLSADYLTSDLAEASRHHEGWREIGTILGAKGLELAISWFGGLDSYDHASLTVLTHFPVLYLLTYFYGVSNTTLLASAAIDTISAFLPFHLLRPVSAAHAPHAHHKNAIANQLILDDVITQVATSLGAAGIYAAALVTSFRSALPVTLAAHFDDLYTLRKAHELEFLTLLLTLLPLGFAARTLLFVPSTGTKSDEADSRRKHFRPATATFQETFLWNFWGWTARERELIKRSVLLISVTAVYVTFQTAGTIKGTDIVGAAWWASVWTTAAAVTGGLFWWVEKAGDAKH